MKNADCKVRSQRLWLSRVRSPNLQFSELSDGGVLLSVALEPHFESPDCSPWGSARYTSNRLIASLGFCSPTLP